MALKFGQPTFLVDDVTGLLGYKNQVSGKDVLPFDPANVAITGGSIGGTAIGTAVPGPVTATTLVVVDPSLSSQASVVLSAVNDSNGVNVKLLGNGAVTPSKTLRVIGGSMQILNDAYNAAILSLSDSGQFSVNALALTGPGSTAIAALYHTAITISPTAVAASSTSEQLFLLTGSLVNDVVVANKPTFQAGLAIGGCRVANNGNIAITFINSSLAAITPTAIETYQVSGIR